MTDHQRAITESIATHPLDGDSYRYFLGTFQTSQGYAWAFMDITAEILGRYVDLLHKGDWDRTRIEGKLLIVPIEQREAQQ